MIANLLKPSRPGSVLGSLLCAGALSACGGGGGGYNGGSPMPALYMVGGTVSGLSSGATLSLLNNGGDALSVTADGMFDFKTSLAMGAAYDVTVGTQPAGENCSVGSPSGTVGIADISSIAVTCSSTPNSAPAGISQSNAVAVTAEAITAIQSFGSSSTTTPGAAPASTPAAARPAAAMPATAIPSAALAAIKRSVEQRMKATARGVQSADSTTTHACAVSGNFTEDDSADGTSSVITFADCVDVANLTLNGTESYSNLALVAGPTAVSVTADVTDDVTVTLGAVSEAESGTFALSGTFTPAKSFVFKLTDVNLAAKISVGAAVVDNEALSNASITLTEDLTISPNQLYADFTYTLASTALNGSITVATTQSIKRIADPAVTRIYPYTGQFVITGSNGVRVRVTILGDETYAPPSGQGQIEIEIDPGSGTFGSPIWMNWAALANFTSAPSALFTIGGTISGLASGATVTLLDDGTDPLTVTANGAFTFLTPLAGSSAYSVTVGTEPSGQTCTVTDGSGTVGSAAVTNVSVTCQ